MRSRDDLITTLKKNCNYFASGDCTLRKCVMHTNFFVGCTEYQSIRMLEQPNRAEPSEPQHKEQTMTGNQSANIFLYNDKVRAVLCNYEPDPPPPGTPAKRDWFKTFDTSLKPGDLVIVPTSTRHGFTVSRVASVDVELDFENLPGEIKWIVGRVDRTDFDKSVQDEGRASNIIRDAEKTKRRKELAAKLLGSAGQELSGLDIVTVPVPALPQPAAPKPEDNSQ